MNYMDLIWIGIAAFMTWVVIFDLVYNPDTRTEKADPIDVSDPDGEDKWGAM